MTISQPNAGYTPQDNRADFGPISPLPTILGNVSIILVGLKIILSDFPVVWGVLRVSESAWKNIRGALIANHKYYPLNIYDQKSSCVGGTPRTNARMICRLSCETKQYPIRKRADRRLKYNKHMSWCSTKGFGHYHRNFFLSLQKTGTLPLL